MNCPICKANLDGRTGMESTCEVVCWYCKAALVIKVEPKSQFCVCPVKPCFVHGLGVSKEIEDGT